MYNLSRTFRSAYSTFRIGVRSTSPPCFGSIFSGGRSPSILRRKKNLQCSIPIHWRYFMGWDGVGGWGGTQCLSTYPILVLVTLKHNQLRAKFEEKNTHFSRSNFGRVRAARRQRKSRKVLCWKSLKISPKGAWFFIFSKSLVQLMHNGKVQFEHSLIKWGTVHLDFDIINPISP